MATVDLERSVQAEQNLWDRIEAEFGLLTELAVAQHNAGRLVAIRRGHQMLYPGFQFGEDRSALTVIGRLRSLAERHDRSETGIVQWLCSPTTYLADPTGSDGGGRPVDLLVSAPDVVVATADRAWGIDW